LKKAVLQIAGFPGTGEKNFAILSRENDSKAIYAIWSSSLEHARLFEKQEKLGKIATGQTDANHDQCRLVSWQQSLATLKMLARKPR